VLDYGIEWETFRLDDSADFIPTGERRQGIDLL